MIPSNVSTQFKHLRGLSVVTPSIFTKKSKTNRSSSIFHPSNPNPQKEEKKRYKGVRDIGYHEYERKVDPLDIVKFGKRVSYESKMTQEEVMKDHLNQMRLNIMNSKNSQSVKLK